ncbi:MAG: hypothetical protein IPO66_21555 [Rhodanobacteraceae bacterium]|nr:hypothetical protein [Rhodanobacteraceae bacterium]
MVPRVRRAPTPAKAVQNADNHEYFSENTPALN